jgi:hypothetical protein
VADKHLNLKETSPRRLRREFERSNTLVGREREAKGQEEREPHKHFVEKFTTRLTISVMSLNPMAIILMY